MHEELIAALEKATGPCRKLDCLIYLARHPEAEIMVDGGGWRGERPVLWEKAALLAAEWKGDWRDFALQLDCPAYTASIDAALTLVPEGWRWHSYYWPRKDEPKIASLVTNKPHAKIAHGKAATLALSLCIAALQAKVGGDG